MNSKIIKPAVCGLLGVYYAVLCVMLLIFRPDGMGMGHALGTVGIGAAAGALAFGAVYAALGLRIGRRSAGKRDAASVAACCVVMCLMSLLAILAGIDFFYELNPLPLMMSAAYLGGMAAAVARI